MTQASTPTLIELGGLDPYDWLTRYLERRIFAANKEAKSSLTPASGLATLRAAHATKIADVNLALRLGLAKVAVDDTCKPTDVSIRYGNHRAVHLPANQIADDMHRRVVEEASRLAGINLSVGS